MANSFSSGSVSHLVSQLKNVKLLQNQEIVKLKKFYFQYFHLFSCYS